MRKLRPMPAQPAVLDRRASLLADVVSGAGARERVLTALPGGRGMMYLAGNGATRKPST